MRVRKTSSLELYPLAIIQIDDTKFNRRMLDKILNNFIFWFWINEKHCIACAWKQMQFNHNSSFNIMERSVQVFSLNMSQVNLTLAYQYISTVVQWETRRERGERERKRKRGDGERIKERFFWIKFLTHDSLQKETKPFYCKQIDEEHMLLTGCLKHRIPFLEGHSSPTVLRRASQNVPSTIARNITHFPWKEEK